MFFQFFWIDLLGGVFKLFQRFLPQIQILHVLLCRIHLRNHLKWSQIHERNRLKKSEIITFYKIKETNINEIYSVDFNLEKIVDDLEIILRDSIRKRLMSDVKIGAYLSGGVDSSLIVALMSEVSINKINTFSVIFLYFCILFFNFWIQFTMVSYSYWVPHKYRWVDYSYCKARYSILSVRPRTYEYTTGTCTVQIVRKYRYVLVL